MKSQTIWEDTRDDLKSVVFKMHPTIISGILMICMKPDHFYNCHLLIHANRLEIRLKVTYQV